MTPESKGSGGTEGKGSRARGCCTAFLGRGGGATVGSDLETPVQAGVWGEFGEVHIWLSTYGTQSPAYSVPILSLMFMVLPLTKHNLPGLRFPISNTGFLHVYILQRTQVQARSKGGSAFVGVGVGGLQAILGNWDAVRSSLREGPLAPSGGTNALCRWTPLSILPGALGLPMLQEAAS